ncbi:protease inhibitor Inh/omp19 family protein [Pseudovibrio exalbescens]|uniref:protease inhibitor Inh/omp19 family protein n=1 Tax=Pseudovibrio exalbescens TaxID=197461 RepID=UPI0023666669|nr:protease inhibitor Inh/omp19 family protein [Pseudovibrio exalbescens]MDD7909744.1 protease inhibitor Inh/omp19 family protein [Pseudovibrio exalbescens]
MNRGLTIALVSVLAISTMACQRTTYTRSYVSPLPATPSTPVAGDSLSPLDQQPGAGQGEITGQPLDGTADGTQVASVAPGAAGGSSVGRTDLLGGWDVASGADSCKLFMTLTTWSGGYRANTRGCSDESLSRIAAWDLNGSQVVLKDAAGSDIAQLSGGGSSFNGVTNSGAPISFRR